MHVSSFSSSLTSVGCAEAITFFFSLCYAYSTSGLFMPHITNSTDAAVRLCCCVKPAIGSHRFYFKTLNINIT